MKLDRLLAILVLLINRGRVQAKDLADTFEVSIRTIYRDIDTLGQAGIPVVTYQGASGGIGLAEGYRLDRNVLTDKDLASIVTALRSVSTSHTNVARDLLMEKLSSIVPEAKNEDFQANTSRFIVDYSMWTHPEALQIKLQLIEQGMDQLRPITFTYCSAEGTQTHRTTDPHTLVLKSIPGISMRSVTNATISACSSWSACETSSLLKETSSASRSTSRTGPGSKSGQLRIIKWP